MAGTLPHEFTEVMSSARLAIDIGEPLQVETALANILAYVKRFPDTAQANLNYAKEKVHAAIKHRDDAIEPRYWTVELGPNGEAGRKRFYREARLIELIKHMIEFWCEDEITELD